MAQVVGIRREVKNQWERRAPLAPVHVRELTDEGVRILVQPSSLRVFSDEEYRRAGGNLSEDLAGCGLILGVKEIPAEEFQGGRVYLFFSHVSKGQPYNMGMLGRILQSRSTLIDYEQVVDASSRRRIFFGRHAGAAGLFEALHALGRRLELEGYSTPFSRVRRPTELSDLEEGRRLLKGVGDEILREGVGQACSPLVVGFAGYGNVSKGAQMFFDELPHEELMPADFLAFIEERSYSDRTLYKVVFREQDFVVPIQEGAAFDLQHYYEHPDRYRPAFERYWPHLTLLLNCIYWDRRYPRLVSKQSLRSAWESELRPRLRVIGDITCDIEGAIECTLRATEPGQPTYTYLPVSESIVEGCNADGVVVMAVDTLPAEVPREATLSFGDMLAPFVRELVSADFTVPFHRLSVSAMLERAVIVYQGELTERYQYLAQYLKS